jgi:hypothetical protein
VITAPNNQLDMIQSGLIAISFVVRFPSSCELSGSDDLTKVTKVTFLRRIHVAPRLFQLWGANDRWRPLRVLRRYPGVHMVRQEGRDEVLQEGRLHEGRRLSCPQERKKEKEKKVKRARGGGLGLQLASKHLALLIPGSDFFGE